MGKINNSLTTYLFSMPGFLTGMARVTDMGSTFDSYNISDTPELADIKAILSDWTMIGQDIQDSIDLYAKKNAAV